MLRRSAVLLAVIGCLALAVAGCGSSKSSSSAAAAATGAAAASTTTTVHFAKTKFLIHAGLAYGAFHHFIYGPIKAGDLKHPFSHKFALVEAGVATVFVAHELKLAYTDVKASKILSTIFAPAIFVADKLSALKTSIISGNANPQDVTNLNSSLGQISSKASAQGQSISDTIPSAAQLVTGG